VQVVDGPDEGRKAVREQIMHGADWIKVYSDRSYWIRADGVLDDIPTFTLDELRAIVDEAHRERHKVASHAMALNGVHNSVEAGVDSIEHGYYLDEECIAEMEKRGAFFVPTLALLDVYKRAVAQPHDMPPWRLRKQQVAIPKYRAYSCTMTSAATFEAPKTLCLLMSIGKSSEIPSANAGSA